MRPDQASRLVMATSPQGHHGSSRQPGQQALPGRLGASRADETTHGGNGAQVNRAIQQDADTPEKDKLRDYELLCRYKLVARAWVINHPVHKPKQDVYSGNQSLNLARRLKAHVDS